MILLSFQRSLTKNARSSLSMMIAVSASVPFCVLTANNIGLPGCTIYIATIRVNLFVDCFLLLFLPLSIAAFYRNRAHHVRPLLCMYIVFPFNLLFNLFSCSLNLSFVALIISSVSLTLFILLIIVWLVGSSSLLPSNSLFSLCSSVIVLALPILLLPSLLSSLFLFLSFPFLQTFLSSFPRLSTLTLPTNAFLKV